MLAYSVHYAFGEDFPVVFTMNESYIQPTTSTKSYLSTMINNALIDSTESQTNLSNEEFKKPYIQPTTSTKSYLSTMINNALIDSTESQTNLSNEEFKEQFISLESLDYNNNMIFEDSSSQTNLLSANNIPFLLPVPFP
ncbi:MAG: hypothetical protein ACE5SW_02180 [Nitrososphaeraceae archaeon]